MAELGRVERPEVGNFHGRRKLYCVPNVYPFHNAPQDFIDLLDQFWEEVFTQTERLELAGKITRIFCENIYEKGEEALTALAESNERALTLIRKKIEEGAVLIPLEDGEIFGPFLDWANCLKVVRTPEVFNKVLGFFNELSEKRSGRILEVISGSLGEGEAGLLIMADEYRARLQFPADIEIFLVTPRSYDDILRWFRGHMKDLGVES